MRSKLCGTKVISFFYDLNFVSQYLKAKSRTIILGPIAGSMGVMSLPSLSFVAVDKLYEIVVEVRKFTMMGSYNYTRVTSKRLQVFISFHKF